MEKEPIFIKMNKEIHDEMLNFITLAKQLHIKALSSKKQIIDKAVREFIVNHPLDRRVLPVNVPGVTKFQY